MNKHHGQKQLGDGSICILQTRVISASQDRSSSGRLKARTEAGSVEECCLLAHFPAGVYLTFYLIPDLLDQLWLHTQWAEPSHINQQSIKCHTDLQQTNVMETLSHWNSLLGGYVSSGQANRNQLAHHRTSLVVLKLGFELGLSLSLEFTVLAPVPTPPWCWDLQVHYNNAAFYAVLEPKLQPSCLHRKHLSVESYPQSHIFSLKTSVFFIDVICRFINKNDF